MPYSTHDDLKQLHKDINELTSEISDFIFGGSGVNDMIPIIVPERKIVVATSIIHFYIQISTVGLTVNKLQWSITGGSHGWTGQDVIITGGIQYLNYGIGVQFNEAYGHTLNDYWRFNLNLPDSSNERLIAYNWVNDRLKPYISTPIVDPSQTIILAEANFAVSLILRANKRDLFGDFRNEADRLVAEMLEIPAKATTPAEISEPVGAE